MITDEESQAIGTGIGAIRMLCNGCSDKGTCECENCDMSKAIKVLLEMKKKFQKEEGVESQS